MNHKTKQWRAQLQETLDQQYVTIRIEKHKAIQLEMGLEQHGYYFLCLEAGFDVEIVKAVSCCNGILTLERGQKGTRPGVWPAGTLIQARITAKMLDDLNLDVDAILDDNEEVLLAPNGDVITKPIF